VGRRDDVRTVDDVQKFGESLFGVVGASVDVFCEQGLSVSHRPDDELFVGCANKSSDTHAYFLWHRRPLMQSHGLNERQIDWFHIEVCDAAGASHRHPKAPLSRTRAIVFLAVSLRVARGGGALWQC